MFDPRGPLGWGPGGDGNDKQPFTYGWWRVGIGLLLMLTLASCALLPATNDSAPPAQITLSYSAFQAQVRANNVKTARLSATAASGDFKKRYTDPATGLP